MKYLIKPTKYLLAYLYLAIKVLVTVLAFVVLLIWHLSIIEAYNECKDEWKHFYTSSVLGLVIFRYKTLNDFINDNKSDLWTDSQ